MTPEEDAAVAVLWPDKWARANNPSLPGRSKARQQLRQQYRHHVAFEAFTAANPAACCGTCQHMSIRQLRRDTPTCDLDSDFHGYQTTSLDNVCIRWAGL